MEEKKNDMKSRYRQIGLNCICFNLRKASRVVSQLYDEALRPVGLKATQFPILLVAAVLPEPTITSMSMVLAMDRTTLTRNLKVLERGGLVEIRPGKDQRKKVVHLTEHARDSLEKGVPLWEEAQARIMDNLSAINWDGLIKDLRKVSAKGGKHKQKRKAGSHC